jgi:hypothetical protein
MFISTQKIFCLVENSFRNFIDILGIGMLALRLSPQALLAKADAFCIIVNEIFLNRIFATCGNSCVAEIILSIFREKMFTGNFFDGGIEICTVIKFFNTTLVIGIALRTLEGISNL